MGLKQIMGEKQPVDYETNRLTSLTDPHLTIGRDGKGQTSAALGDLLGITRLDDPQIVKKVIDFAEAIPEDKPWTKQQVVDLCTLVGTMPFSKSAHVEHVKHQGTLLVRLVNQSQGKGIVQLVFAKRRYPTFNVLPALKDEGIVIPTGMCLEAPVALVMDEGVLKVEVWLRQGYMREVKKRDSDGE